MAGISRYEKAALGLTAAFLLFTGGWFYARQSAAQPYTVTVSQSAPEESPAPAASGSEEERPDSLLEGEVIDINSAPAEDLERLPGIGEKRLRPSWPGGRSTAPSGRWTSLFRSPASGKSCWPACGTMPRQSR